MRIQSMNSSSQLYKGFFNFTVMHHHRQKNGLFTREKEEGKKRGFSFHSTVHCCHLWRSINFHFSTVLNWWKKMDTWNPRPCWNPPSFLCSKRNSILSSFQSEFIKKKIIIKNERMMKTKKDTIVMYSGKVPLWLLNGWIVRCSIRLFHLDNNTISDS